MWIQRSLNQRSEGSRIGAFECPGHPRETAAKAGKNGDGLVTIKEICTFLDQQVPKYISEHVHEKQQHPLVGSDENLKEVAVNGYGVPLLGEVTSIQGDTT